MDGPKITTRKNKKNTHAKELEMEEEKITQPRVSEEKIRVKKEIQRLAEAGNVRIHEKWRRWTERKMQRRTKVEHVDELGGGGGGGKSTGGGTQ